ncbi:DoxX family protein [Hymenobacter cheonanensis]|uniref:DoxX family protein n=1 Tax=Hymenobacter sp. CA2-7 TaxID=3063993 RepID=UPI00271298D5|nr:DoxX family protein [Hymenobacter sp. CA2-7]MDO7887904.1 DoxX family protein [Hymenobacter sp. CA2-7]
MAARNIISWVLQVLIGLAMIFSGANKFLHLTDTVAMFGKLGLPAAITYLVAAGEVLGGIGLLVPRFVRPAALGLIIIMIGAVVMHATKIPGGLLPNGLPALGLLLGLVIILLLRRPAPAQLA